MADQVMAYIQSNPSGLFLAYNQSALIRRLTQVGGRFYGDRGGTLEANVRADTALEAQGGDRCYGDGGGMAGHDSPLAQMQRIGGPLTLDCFFIDASRLFTSPPL